MYEIVIDPEFEVAIPPLTDQELELLERSLLAEGCRDPLVIWKELNILLDGHHRYKICRANGLDFGVSFLSLSDREAALDWIDANQLGRRNLTPDQMSLLRGRRYNRVKKGHGAEPGGRGNQYLVSGQNDHLPKTAESLATEHGVSEVTIRRDGRFATAVEQLKADEPDIERRVIRGQAPPKAAILKAAEILEKEPEKARAILHGELKTADVVREMKREEIKTRLEDIKTKEAKELAGIFDVIVIDPPWPMEKIERSERPNQSELDYPAMDVWCQHREEDRFVGVENERIPCYVLADYGEEIAEKCLSIECAVGRELLKIEEEKADSHVWIWTTNKFLPVAFKLLNQWELKYVCTFVWHKPGGFQPVNLPQYNCEFALYARKGSPVFLDTKALPTCFQAPRGEHSEKPDEFYEMIRRVTAGRRLDMFARKTHEGFEAWGNEIGAES